MTSSARDISALHLPPPISVSSFLSVTSSSHFLPHLPYYLCPHQPSHRGSCRLHFVFLSNPSLRFLRFARWCLLISTLCKIPNFPSFFPFPFLPLHFLKHNLISPPPKHRHPPPPLLPPQLHLALRHHLPSWRRHNSRRPPSLIPNPSLAQLTTTSNVYTALPFPLSHPQARSNPSPLSQSSAETGVWSRSPPPPPPNPATVSFGGFTRTDTTGIVTSAAGYVDRYKLNIINATAEQNDKYASLPACNLISTQPCLPEDTPLTPQI